MKQILLDHLTKAFKSRVALEGIDARLEGGKFIAVAGPDGAGKTTLIRLIAALLLPSKGRILLDDFDTVKVPEEIHQRIGYMPQRFGLYEDLTVLQNLTLYADLQGVVGEERKESFAHLLKMMNLERFQDRLAGKLSGGMKQKLGLACALVRKPELLLMDEPTVGVDPISRRELWSMMQEFLKQGITIVWSTAYLDEAEKADTALLLHEGKLLFAGAPRELMHRMEGRTYKMSTNSTSKRQFLRELLSQKNVQDATLQGSDVRVVLKENTPEEGWTACPPRFEDAVIDLLGGGPGGTSVLKTDQPNISSQKNPIEAKGLTKKFGDFTAVDNVSFAVQSGEVFGLLGPNGAGKSTTFKMLCGLLHPTAGSAIVCGENLETAPSIARSKIGYMAQKFSLYENLNVEQNLWFFSGAYNLTGQKRRDAVGEMIQLFHLQPFLNESANTLPLGIKQRLALACALMHEPAVLFLDEPTSGVDPITRREFWNHINALAEKGCTILVTTHFMDEAEYCDRVGLIYQSKLIHIGTVEEIKALAKTEENPSPTLEDAFIRLIEEYDRKN